MMDVLEDPLRACASVVLWDRRGSSGSCASRRQAGRAGRSVAHGVRITERYPVDGQAHLQPTVYDVTIEAHLSFKTRDGNSDAHEAPR